MNRTLKIVLVIIALILFGVLVQVLVRRCAKDTVMRSAVRSSAPARRNATAPPAPPRTTMGGPTRALSLLDVEQESVDVKSAPALEQAVSATARASALATACSMTINATAPSENETSVEVVADGAAVEHPLTGKLHDQWTIVIPTECGSRVQSVSVRFLPSRVTLMYLRGAIVIDEGTTTRRRPSRP